MRTARQFFRDYSNIIFFVGGFVFDALTLVRIDSVLDLSLQAFYLVGITILLISKERADMGFWTPTGFIQKIWHYETEAIHFMYGGLLSAYVIFYFKSTSFSRSIIFFSVIVFLMFVNEMPQLRKTGAFMRLGLFAFCVVSFLNYLFPVLIGSMGWPIFILAWVVSAWITWLVVGIVARLDPDPKKAKWRLSWAPAGVLVLIFVLYGAKLIPPVPLSMRYIGVYHDVQVQGDNYQLTFVKPPWYRFWRKDDRHFLARPGDRIYCFVRLFAPRRFHHRTFVKWEKYEPIEGWVIRDRIALAISGGRDEGFRGITVKENYEAGRWRVTIETEDGRALGALVVHVETDLSQNEPILETRVM